MGNKLLLCFIVSMGLTSCSLFKKDFSSIAWECGLAESSDRGSLAKIVRPDGTDLSPEELETTRGRWLMKTGETLDLTPSPKGCFSLPKTPGIFQAFTLQGLQVSQPMVARPHGLQVLTLHRDGPGEAELVCPSQGYFVNQELEFPIRMTGSVASEASRLRLVARNTQTGEETDLFLKDYGTALPTSVKALPAEMLKEGSYELRLEAMAINRRWDVSVLPLNGRSLCPLAVLHALPKVGGDLELGGDVKSFYKQGEAMNWLVSSPFSELRVCAEPRTADEDELPAGDRVGCQARKICDNLETFRPATALRADAVGVFDYFFYAENRAGLKTDVQCKRVLISDQKPQLQIAWQEADWNRPTAVMSVPRPVFGAVTSVHHAQYADADLERKLECKVDFLLDGIASLPGKDVLCLSGRCAGRRLDRFVPCDTTLRASLAGFWKEQRARPVLMRLHVQATDGAGQSTEAVKSVWIHPQRWQPEAGPLMPGYASDPGDTRFFAAAGDALYAKTSGRLAQWDAGSRVWNNVELPFPGDPTFTKMLPTAEGGFFLVGRTEDRVEAYERTESGWKPAETALDLTPCMQGWSMVHPLGGFLCIGSDRYLQYHKGLWSEVSWPNLDDGTPCYVFGQNFVYKTIVLQKDGSILRSCPDGSLHVREPEGSWKRMASTLPGVTFMDVDAKGRIWLLQDHKAGFIQNGQWTAVELPTIHQDSASGFSLTQAGSVLYYDYLWDDRTASFVRLEGLNELSPAQNYRSIPVGPGQYLLSNQSELLLWDAGEILQYPVNWFGVEIRDYDVTPVSVRLGTGRELWFMQAERPGEARFTPTRVPFYKSNTFGPEVNLFSRKNESRTYSFWVEDSGDISLLVTDRGLVRSRDEGWETVWDSGGRVVSWGGRTKNRHYYFVDDDLQKVLHVRENQTQADVLDDRGQYTLTQMPSGKVLLRSSANREGWFLSESGAARLSYPTEVTGNVLVDIGGQTVLWSVSGNPIYRLNEADLSWIPVSLNELGLPEQSKAPLFRTDLKSDISFVEVDDQLALIDRTHGTSRPFLVPDEFNAGMISKILEISADDFLVLVPSYGIYRGDGRTWKPVVLQEELQARLRMEDRTYLHDMQLDRFGRLWVAGEYFRLFMQEL